MRFANSSIVSVATLVGSASVASAAVTFTDLTPGATTFSPPLLFNPTINNAGQVAAYVSGFGATPAGMYTNVGGSFSLIEAGNSATFASFPKAVIDEAGAVSYFIRTGTSTNEIRRYANGAKSTFLSFPPARMYLYNYQAQGNGLIYAGLEPGQTGGQDFSIYKVPTAGNQTAVVNTSGPYKVVTQPNGAEDGRYAFYGELDDGTAKGIYTGPNPITDRFVDTTGPWANLDAAVPFSGVVMSNDGRIVFDGTPTTGPEGLFTGPDPLTSRVASFGAGQPYSSLAPDEYAINSSGAVVFAASLDANNYGIFNGPDPVANRLIGLGDTLFGGTIDYLDFGPNALNDNGDFVFFYELDNGRGGLAIGHIPEPASAALLATVSGIALGRRGRTRAAKI